MRKILLISLFLVMTTLIFAKGKKNVGFCDKIYPRKKIVKGVKIENCDKSFFNKPLMNLDYEAINLDSIITKNKFTLIAFSSIYAIGCGSNIGVREALLKSLIKKYRDKIVEMIEYWDNYEMKRTVSEIQNEQIKQSFTFELVKDLPIYLDKDSKNIFPIIQETGAKFLHSGWAIVDSNHHIKYLFMEGTCEKPRKIKKTKRIIEKYLSQ